MKRLSSIRRQHSSSLSTGNSSWVPGCVALFYRQHQCAQQREFSHDSVRLHPKEERKLPKFVRRPPIDTDAQQQESKAETEQPHQSSSATPISVSSVVDDELATADSVRSYADILGRLQVSSSATPLVSDDPSLPSQESRVSTAAMEKLTELGSASQEQALEALALLSQLRCPDNNSDTATRQCLTLFCKAGSWDEALLMLATTADPSWKQQSTPSRRETFATQLYWTPLRTYLVEHSRPELQAKVWENYGKKLFTLDQLSVMCKHTQWDVAARLASVALSAGEDEKERVSAKRAAEIVVSFCIDRLPFSQWAVALSAIDRCVSTPYGQLRAMLFFYVQKGRVLPRPLMEDYLREDSVPLKGGGAKSDTALRLADRLLRAASMTSLKSFQGYHRRFHRYRTACWASALQLLLVAHHVDFAAKLLEQLQGPHPQHGQGQGQQRKGGPVGAAHIHYDWDPWTLLKPEDRDSLNAYRGFHRELGKGTSQQHHPISREEDEGFNWELALDVLRTAGKRQGLGSSLHQSFLFGFAEKVAEKVLAGERKAEEESETTAVPPESDSSSKKGSVSPTVLAAAIVRSLTLRREDTAAGTRLLFYAPHRIPLASNHCLFASPEILSMVLPLLPGGTAATVHRLQDQGSLLMPHSETRDQDEGAQTSAVEWRVLLRSMTACGNLPSAEHGGKGRPADSLITALRNLGIQSLKVHYNAVMSDAKSVVRNPLELEYVVAVYCLHSLRGAGEKNCFREVLAPIADLFASDRVQLPHEGAAPAIIASTILQFWSSVLPTFVIRRFEASIGANDSATPFNALLHLAHESVRNEKASWTAALQAIQAHDFRAEGQQRNCVLAQHYCLRYVPRPVFMKLDLLHSEFFRGIQPFVASCIRSRRTDEDTVVKDLTAFLSDLEQKKKSQLPIARLRARDFAATSNLASLFLATPPTFSTVFFLDRRLDNYWPKLSRIALNVVLPRLAAVNWRRALSLFLDQPPKTDPAVPAEIMKHLSAPVLYRLLSGPDSVFRQFRDYHPRGGMIGLCFYAIECNDFPQAASMLLQLSRGKHNIGELLARFVDKLSRCDPGVDPLSMFSSNGSSTGSEAAAVDPGAASPAEVPMEAEKEIKRFYRDTTRTLGRLAKRLMKRDSPFDPRGLAPDLAMCLALGLYCCQVLHIRLDPSTLRHMLRVAGLTRSQMLAKRVRKALWRTLSIQDEVWYYWSTRPKGQTATDMSSEGAQSSPWCEALGMLHSLQETPSPLQVYTQQMKPGAAQKPRPTAGTSRSDIDESTELQKRSDPRRSAPLLLQKDTCSPVLALTVRESAVEFHRYSNLLREVVESASPLYTMVRDPRCFQRGLNTHIDFHRQLIAIRCAQEWSAGRLWQFFTFCAPVLWLRISPKAVILKAVNAKDTEKLLEWIQQAPVLGYPQGAFFKATIVEDVPSAELEFPALPPLLCGNKQLLESICKVFGAVDDVTMLSTRGQAASVAFRSKEDAAMAVRVLEQHRLIQRGSDLELARGNLCVRFKLKIRNAPRTTSRGGGGGGRYSTEKKNKSKSFSKKTKMGRDSPSSSETP